MPRAERSDRPSSDDDALPEGTEHVVLLGHNHNAFGTNPNEYRCSAVRLARYEDVEIEEYIDEDEDPENVTVVFGPGDELPIPVAADGTYRSFSDMFACLSADGERLDSAGAGGVDDGVQQWKAGGD